MPTWHWARSQDLVYPKNPQTNVEYQAKLEQSADLAIAWINKTDLKTRTDPVATTAHALLQYLTDKAYMRHAEGKGQMAYPMESFDAKAISELSNELDRFYDPDSYFVRPGPAGPDPLWDPTVRSVV